MITRMRVFLVFCFALFSVLVSAQTLQQDQTDGEIYVKYSNEFPVDNRKYLDKIDNLAESDIPVLPSLDKEFSQKFGIYKITRPFITAKSRTLNQIFKVYFKNPADAANLIKALSVLSHIDYAEPVPYNTTGYQPNDMGVNSGNGQYALWITKAREAWDIERGDSTITVAIVDDGLSMFHPDLFDNVWRNPHEIAGNNIDDDNNGYVDDIYGWDAGDNDNDPVHPNTNFTHGTHVGGIAGAVTDNNIGVASIGFGISIMPVKCTFNKQSSATSIPMGYEGLTYAANAGADIINCSWSSAQPSQTAQNVIDYATSRGCIVVAAASNDGVEEIRYPAAYNGVIAVASTDDSDSKSGFSNYGSWVDVSAPGSAIKSTIAQGNGYTGFSGTSMATPMVAGLLGLMKSHNPNLSNAKLEQCLIDSADNIYNINPSYIGKMGSGRINAKKSLQCVDQTLVAKPKAQIQSVQSLTCPGMEVHFQGSSTQGKADTYKWYFTGGNPLISTAANPIVNYNAIGKYDVKLVVTNAQGSDSITLTDYLEVAAKGRETILSESFETGTLTNMGFTIENTDNGTTWALTNVGGAENGTRALQMGFYNYSQVGQRDGLITPVFSLNGNSGTELSFQHSYRARNITKKDSLIIYVSIDSGKTFPYRVAEFAENGTLNFATKGAFSGSFLPANPTDWCYSTMSGKGCFGIDLSAFDGEQNVAIKFESYNDAGNNLYIDNLAITAFCSGYNTQKPKAAFANSDTVFCLPQTVKFKDESENFPTSYQWIFDGGTPSTSTDRQPQVTYNAAGQYNVTLITNNAFGYDTLELTNYIVAEASPVIDIVASDTILCRGKSTNLIGKGANDYKWSPIFGISSNVGDTIIANPPSNVTYTVIGTTQNGCSSTKNIFIKVLPGPGITSITKVGDSLVATNANPTVLFQWLFNGSDITGERGNKYRPTQTGNYGIRATDTSGCENYATNYFFSTIGIEDVVGSPIKVYPNPAVGNVFIENNYADSPLNVRIFDNLGKTIIETEIAERLNTIDVSALNQGVYFITLHNNRVNKTLKIIVGKE